MQKNCAICNRPLLGLTVTAGRESFHPDCFRKTAAGQKIEKEFQDWLKNNNLEKYEKAILKQS